MGFQYRCASERRRDALRGFAGLNGIDYLEVVDREAADPARRQRRLLVRFVNALAPGALGPGNVTIAGGQRVRGVRVTGVEIGSGLDADRLTVDVDRAGDFSTYTLRLVAGGDDDAPPPAGFDPVLSEIDFSFKVECPSDFDCGTETTCPPAATTAPDIDYLVKDYASFRQLMLDRLAVVMPGWEERNAADLGVVLVELLAYAADRLSYYQDAAATEAYLGTARRRVSVRRHARLLDYAMHDGANARAWVHVEVESDGLALAEGTQLLTRVAGQATVIAPDSPVYEEALAGEPEVFETLHDVTLFAAHNELRFYTWGDEDCRLPKGATRATLAGRLGDLAAGDVLVFEEVRGPGSGRADEADPAHRHVVRLRKVTASIDPLGGQFLDPPRAEGVPVTEIEWMEDDALPFTLCLAMVEVPASEGTAAGEEPVSVARGNLVLADHGRTVEDEALAEVVEGARYRPRLAYPDVTQAVPHDDETARTQAAATALAQDPREAVAVVTLTDGTETWTARCDLLASDRFATEFVVETESDGRAQLRFGDGVYGKAPSAGTAFQATYRVGNGAAGNVGAEAIAHVVTTGAGITAVRNVVPAAGGVDPESLEEVRESAPRAFRTQERAVTEADYAAVAQRYAGVQKAVATRRWTGSWYTMFLTVDRRGGREVDTAFEAELGAFMEPYRLAGHEVEVEKPRYVALDIALTVCVAEGYFASDVEEALLEVFGNQDLADGRRGFFHPDNFTFGQPVYLSRIVAAAMAVPGVAWVDTDDTPPKPTRFRRWGEPSHGELGEGRIAMGRLEIARLDNDPNAPENGRLRFFMEGGR